MKGFINFFTDFLFAIAILVFTFLVPVIFKISKLAENLQTNVNFYLFSYIVTIVFVLSFAIATLWRRGGELRDDVDELNDCVLGSESEFSKFKRKIEKIEKESEDNKPDSSK